MSLCFDEAFQALKTQRISEEEYLHHVLAHFCGIRHPADEKATRPWESMINDPVGNAIREAALKLPQTKPESITQLEQLFGSALKDDAQSVQAIISKLDQHTIPLQAITTFAALHNDAQVLRLCLSLGASLDDKNTCIALEYANRTPALLDVLFHHDWRDMRTNQLSFNRMLEWSLHTGPDELNWFLQHGAHIDKETIRHAVHGSPVKALCVESLLKRHGVELFRGTRLLQSAAKRGKNDIVKLLLEAGAEVDELVPRSSHDDGECEATALYEAVYKQHEDTIRLLLDFGADPCKEVCVEDGLNTPLKLAAGHGYARIVATLRQSLERNRRPGAEKGWSSRL